MTEPYLTTLNPEQRHAVEHSGDQPLLIIAGAGSGKTNTLAHRVAHLMVQRADPRRMMLLTFSRRAAAEMSRRVERIAAQVMPEHGRLMVDHDIRFAWHVQGNRAYKKQPLADLEFVLRHSRLKLHKEIRPRDRPRVLDAMPTILAD